MKLDGEFDQSGEPAPGQSLWDRTASMRALDELFSQAAQYRTTTEFRNLLEFVCRFRKYAPYNAMLLHIQMPGASYVAPARRWQTDFGRRLTPDARPLVILQPKCPVMFVFDVSHTTAEPDAPPLPQSVTAPFEPRGREIGDQLERTIDNARRDGVRVTATPEGSLSAGSIRQVRPGEEFDVVVRTRPTRETVRVPVRYDVIVNSALSTTACYCTLTHELAHLYCGHLGTPNETWWPDRRDRSTAVCEFEAEAISWLVAHRLGIDSPSAAYLSGYYEKNSNVPDISLELIMKTAGLIEQMGRERLPLRKDPKSTTPRRT